MLTQTLPVHSLQAFASPHMEGGNLLSEEGLEVELQIQNTGQDDLENFADCAKPQGFHGESLQATRSKTVLKFV